MRDRIGADVFVGREGGGHATRNVGAVRAELALSGHPTPGKVRGVLPLLGERWFCWPFLKASPGPTLPVSAFAALWRDKVAAQQTRACRGFGRANGAGKGKPES
jgi:hypothetical protein